MQADYKSGNINEIYHYDVNISKAAPEPREGEGAGGSRPPRAPRSQGPLPSSLCRAAISALAQKLQWPAGIWAFDGRANM